MCSVFLITYFDENVLLYNPVISQSDNNSKYFISRGHLFEVNLPRVPQTKENNLGTH